jgi:hypothetical protein
VDVAGLSKEGTESAVETIHGTFRTPQKCRDVKPLTDAARGGRVWASKEKV